MVSGLTPTPHFGEHLLIDSKSWAPNNKNASPPHPLFYSFYLSNYSFLYASNNIDKIRVQAVQPRAHEQSKKYYRVKN